MFVLKKCLFVMKLETGGLIIGCIHLLIQVLAFLFCAAYLSIYDCSDFEKLIQFPDDRICKFNRDFIFFAILLLTTSAGLAIFSYYNCIKGIREKNFMLLKPFVGFLAVVTILSMYEIVFFTFQGLLMALIKGAITGYMFLVVFSYYIWLTECIIVPSDEKGEKRSISEQDVF